MSPGRRRRQVGNPGGTALKKVVEEARDSRPAELPRGRGGVHTPVRRPWGLPGAGAGGGGRGQTPAPRATAPPSCGAGVRGDAPRKAHLQDSLVSGKQRTPGRAPHPATRDQGRRTTAATRPAHLPCWRLGSQGTLWSPAQSRTFLLPGSSGGRGSRISGQRTRWATLVC